MTAFNNLILNNEHGKFYCGEMTIFTFGWSFLSLGSCTEKTDLCGRSVKTSYSLL